VSAPLVQRPRVTIFFRFMHNNKFDGQRRFLGSLTGYPSAEAG